MASRVFQLPYWLFLLGMMLWGQSMASQKQPNIVFVLTDDQDMHMESLAHMPLVQKYLLNEGTLYRKHYCTIALCCPSRVNLWTGKAAHNTNVTDVVPPHGGYPKFVKQGFNDNYLPVWLQQAGYNTYYVGKLFNAHTTENYNKPFAGGFTGSDFILDPFTYQYYNVSMTRNGAEPVNYLGQYSPDLTAEKAYGFLEEGVTHDKPFFLAIAPIASHSNVVLEPFVASTPQYAERHANLFKDYKIPRSKNFNPDKASGVNWVANLPKLNDTVIEYNDEFQRSRLRSLQSVDEMVEELVKRLAGHGVLDNTYFFYTTDNGYHISQHRMHPGKECGYETDINIPLIVRGPGVGVGKVLDAVTSHTDLAPTIMKLAGGDIRDDFDGLPIPLSPDDRAKTEHVNVEYWGLGIPEGKYGYSGKYMFEGGTANAYVNNTYKALRLIGDTYSLYYAVWCTNETELYDMCRDPDQIHNLATMELLSDSGYKIAGRHIKDVMARLDALMMVLKSCKASSCTDPWKTLHPDGEVNDLSSALRLELDAFYEEQLKVSFTKCELGYIVESEGPQHIVDFDRWNEKSDDGTSRFREELRSEGRQRPLEYRLDWSVWT